MRHQYFVTNIFHRDSKIISKHFLGNDDVFARKCIGKAIALYKFANKFRGSYHQSITDAINGYQSYNGFDDELAWACLWIHKATGAKNRVWIQKTTEHVRQMNKAGFQNDFFSLLSDWL